ncbi:unnamed protein product, partial [Laminaria digitata]
QQAKQAATVVGDIDRSPMTRPAAKPEPNSEPMTEESESDNPLLAAKRRARKQFDD